MTAALGGAAEAAAGGGAAGGGAAGAGAGAAAKAVKPPPLSSPSPSGPVGTAPASASGQGAMPRTQNQLRQKKAVAKKTAAAKKSAGLGTGKTTTTRKGRNITSTTTKRSAFPAFFGGGGGRGGRGGVSGSNARRILVGEFVLCAIIVAFSPLTDKHKGDSPTQLAKRSTAICALFLLLGLVSTGGEGASRLAAAFGALVLVALMVSDRSIFSVITTRFGAGDPEGPAGPAGEGGTAPSSGEGVPDIGTVPSLGIPTAPPSGGIAGSIASGLGPI